MNFTFLDMAFRPASSWKSYWIIVHIFVLKIHKFDIFTLSQMAIFDMETTGTGNSQMSHAMMGQCIGSVNL